MLTSLVLAENIRQYPDTRAEIKTYLSERIENPERLLLNDQTNQSNLSLIFG